MVWDGFVRGALVLAAALALGACAGSSAGQSGSASEPRAVSVTMRDLAFEPASVAVPRGELARIEVRNDGQQAHDFTVQRLPAERVSTKGGATVGGHDQHAASGQYALHLALEPSKAGQVEFRPTEPGEYEFFCTVAGHREAGMRGVLEVE